MREAIKKFGGDPDQINPIVRADLVIDHSIQVDYFGSPDAFRLNVQKEFQRNQERYSLLKWAQKSFKNFNVIPPGTGIIHQVNLEYLAHVVLTDTHWRYRSRSGNAWSTLLYALTRSDRS